MNTKKNQSGFSVVAFAWAFAFVLGCVSESGVIVKGVSEDELGDFSAGNSVEAVTGSTGVSMGNEVISGKAGEKVSVTESTGVRAGDGRVLGNTAAGRDVVSGPSYVKTEAGTVFATETSRVEESTCVAIESDPAEREIQDGGIDISGMKAVAVLPPPEDRDESTRLVGKKVYVELMRQLEMRGCRLAARYRGETRRPADLQRLLENVAANGYDIGYKITLAESFVDAPPADAIVEILGCHTDMVSGKNIAIVRVRRPSAYGSPLKARSYRSRIPSTDIAVAVSSLFSGK